MVTRITTMTMTSAKESTGTFGNRGEETKELILCRRYQWAPEQTTEVPAERRESCRCVRTGDGGSGGRTRGRIQRHGMTTGWWLVTMVVVVLTVLLDTASASCTKGVTELWAYTNPSFEVFHDTYKKYITSSRSAMCRWVVIAANKEWSVELKFDPFELKNSTGSKKGDCLDIYNGDGTDAPLLDRICDRKPKTYTSKGRKLFVVYRRGKVEGNRKIGFEYKSISEDNTEQLIKIASIVGGSLAALGLIYVVVRFTHCFDCLRRKGGEEENTTHTNNHTNHERDRLTVQMVEDTEVESGRTVVAAVSDTANGLSVVNSNGEGMSSAQVEGGDSNIDGLVTGEAAGGEDNSLGSDSDTDSLPHLNEPPPSYESLYLNDDGIEPPEYTPPKHQIKNPPRRVHTFN